MEAAALTDPKAWLQQHSPALRLMLSNSLKKLRVKKLRTAKTGQITVTLKLPEKVKQVQVSPKVRQVTNPSRLKEEPKHLPKKPLQHHNPPTHNQVPARIPPMPQQRFPPRTPPKTWRRKPHPILLSTLKVTSNTAHIDNFTKADRQQVFKCIRDRTGRFLSEDDFAMYVEKGEGEKKPKYRLTQG